MTTINIYIKKYRGFEIRNIYCQINLIYMQAASQVEIVAGSQISSTTGQICGHNHIATLDGFIDGAGALRIVIHIGLDTQGDLAGISQHGRVPLEHSQNALHVRNGLADEQRGAFSASLLNCDQRQCVAQPLVFDHQVVRRPKPFALVGGHARERNRVDVSE